MVLAELIEMSGITKHFGGTAALRGVDFSMRAGEVHSLVGENGAGKSTLMSVMSGRILCDRGTLSVDGTLRRFRGPSDAIACGIAMIYQELALAPDLSVAENIFLGSLPTRIGWRALRRAARALIERLGFDIDPAVTVGSLAIAHQQVVEIAKALSCNARLIVFDEPTAVLAARDADQLLRTVAELRRSGVAVAYISHRLEEVMQISDRITILKDGATVTTVTPDKTDIDTVIRLMVGRPLSAMFGQPDHREHGPEVIRVEGLRRGRRVRDVSFSVHAREIVGLGGLVGSGRTEVARLIFGADRRDSGAIFLGGKEAKINQPKDAVAAGIALVPEDRKGQVVILDLPISVNMTIARLASVVNVFGFLRRAREAAIATGLARQLQVKMAMIQAPVSSLSGGNQQKVVLAKWFHLGGRLIILDEPTRGVDVGAKAEIYALIRRLASEGLAVLVISSEHQELFGLCDRVLVMGEGQLRGELRQADYSEEKLLSLAINRVSDPERVH
jgi:ribose transport system ATP-binding protein